MGGEPAMNQMPDLRLSAVRVFVPDVLEAVPFYRDTLGLAPRVVDANGGFAVFDAGIMLILEPVGDDPVLTRRFSGVSLETPDIEATCRDLAARGVVFDAPPHREEWGGTLAHFADPAGNTLTLVEYPK